MRIVVAMSGGVDSSVAAALLAEQGHDVIGVSMQLYDNSQITDAASARSGPAARSTTSTTRAASPPPSASRTTSSISSRSSASTSSSNFVREYVHGRTPIPCSHCNSDLKFAELLDRAKAYDAEQLATGHYARIERDAGGRYHLYRGADNSKDQTYFLFSLTQEQLSRAAFPVGHLDKHAVRAHAERLKLHVTQKPDSQEICFVPDGDYAAFVERKAPEAARPGTVVDNDGRVLGTHAGVHRFTIGQRKGLGLSSTEPLYVLEIKPDSGAGGRRLARRSRSNVADRVRRELDQRRRRRQIGCGCTRRSGIAMQPRRRESAVTDGGRAELEFDAPQTAITPGQAVVFYDGDEVLGGGWID